MANRKAFSSWLSLCGFRGGEVLKSRTKRSRQRTKQAFKLAAYSLHSRKSVLGAYYRRMKAKHGPEKAIIATAHKLARLFYKMLKYGMEYVDQGQKHYEQQHLDRTLKGLQKKAGELGFTLTPSKEAAQKI